MPDPGDIKQMLDICRDIALEAGAVALHHYGRSHDIRMKSDLSPITDADIAVDALIYQRLKAHFTDIPVVSEEQVENHKEAFGDQPFFLVDPIDGTKEFISRNGEFTINIALIVEHVPVLGAILAPAKNALYYGATGIGAFESHAEQFDDICRNDKEITALPPQDKSVRMAVSRSHLNEETIEFIQSNPNSERVVAGSSLKFCLLASGKADIYPRFNPTMEWDTAAGHAILIAAGGNMTRLDARPFLYGKPGFKNEGFIARAPGVSYTMPFSLSGE